MPKLDGDGMSESTLRLMPFDASLGKSGLVKVTPGANRSKAKNETFLLRMTLSNIVCKAYTRNLLVVTVQVKDGLRRM